MQNIPHLVIAMVNRKICAKAIHAFLSLRWLFKKKPEAIQKKSIDCHESANANSRNDDKTPTPLRVVTPHFPPPLRRGLRGWV